VFPSCPPQQPAQFCGVQGVPSIHIPPTQIIEEPQSTHAAPPCPQAVGETPLTQVPLAVQHPPGQVFGPQDWSVHVPPMPLELATHCPVPSLGTQREHAAPPLPHATSEDPTEQVFTPQQPAQFEGPQFSCIRTHVPLQISSCAHAMHACPSDPHCWTLCAVTQAEPLQQPAQF
jgi:hypothetical protein